MPYQIRNPATDDLQKAFGPIVALLRGGTRPAMPAVALKGLVLLIRHQGTRTPAMILVGHRRHTGPVRKAGLIAEFPFTTGATA